MTLNVTCEILRNVKVDTYMAVEGENLLVLVDGRGNEIDRNLSKVLWCGSGSPYPTPPGGPWSTKYVASHARFGRCFQVNSDRESEIFIHHAAKKSYGCFIINPTTAGGLFMERLIDNKDGLMVVQHQVVDNRSAAEQTANPIDYSKMKNYIA
jgi:hypothetical protein